MSLFLATIIIDVSELALATMVGVLGSGIFFFYLSRLKPKIQISPCIARGQNTQGELIYRIKVINRSLWALVDIRADLQIIRTSTEDERFSRSKDIDLKRSNPLVIGAYPIFTGSSRKNFVKTSYRYRFTTYEDLDHILEDSSVTALRFRVFCRHSYSGFGKVFAKKYQREDDAILPGDFKYDDTFEIVEDNAESA